MLHRLTHLLSVSSSTVYSTPSKVYLRPAERADASILMSEYGKLRSVSTLQGRGPGPVSRRVGSASPACLAAGRSKHHAHRA